MSETNDKPLSPPTETEEREAANDETTAPNETDERDAIDPDDEAAIIEAPDPGFVAPAE